MIRSPMTREVALSRLHGLAPRLGHAYTEGRNTTRSALDEPTTSVLSPYLRRRLVTEHEVVDAVVGVQGGRAQKFIEEVFWRSYFKGHLETRPVLWDNYRELVAEAQGRVAANAGLRRALAEAEEGRTGIDGFDDWAHELVAHNWLHNHARMWFASIWIFTLKLPWALGADFFMRHLMDGDPASNTLSWRWVAGLHTRGKPYVARAENIRRYTDGRYDPRGLNENPVPLDDPTVPPRPLPPLDTVPTGEVALLLHLDDLNPESLPLNGATVVRVGGLLAHADGAAPRVQEADRAAMDDALARAAAYFNCPAQTVTDHADWADGRPVVAAWAPVGPSAMAMPPCARVRRGWDEAAWPLSTRGFFQLRTAIPTVLDLEGIGSHRMRGVENRMA